MERLPTELAHEIFCKLPINAILRSKRVCKAWRKLISDPDFAGRYSKNPPPIASIFLSRYQYDVLFLSEHQISLLEITERGEFFLTPFNPNCLPNYSENYPFVYLVGSCNGLVCLYIRTLYNSSLFDTVYVINPIVRNLKIALPPRERNFNTTAEYSFCDFTVLRIVPNEENIDGEIDGTAEIFTIGVDNEWRSLGDELLNRLLHGSRGVVLNGAYSFILFYDYEFVLSICSIDLGEEKGSHIPMTQELQSLSQSWDFKLVVLNSQLCVFYYCSEWQMTIWTMKEYGVAESWTKDVFSFTGEFADQHFPVSILPNGEILFSVVDQDYLVSYDTKQQRFTKFQFCDAKVVFTYVIVTKIVFGSVIISNQ